MTTNANVLEFVAGINESSLNAMQTFECEAVSHYEDVIEVYEDIVNDWKDDLDKLVNLPEEDYNIALEAFNDYKALTKILRKIAISMYKNSELITKELKEIAERATTGQRFSWAYNCIVQHIEKHDVPLTSEHVELLKVIQSIPAYQ